MAFGCREGVERCAGTDLVAAATASVAGEQSVPKQEVTIVFDATSAPKIISGVATHGTPIHHDGRPTGDVHAAAMAQMPHRVPADRAFYHCQPCSGSHIDASTFATTGSIRHRVPGDRAFYHCQQCSRSHIDACTAAVITQTPTADLEPDEAHHSGLHMNDPSVSRALLPDHNGCVRRSPQHHVAREHELAAQCVGAAGEGDIGYGRVEDREEQLGRRVDGHHVAGRMRRRRRWWCGWRG